MIIRIRLSIIFALALFCCPNAEAKEREYLIQGRVLDNFTGTGIGNVSVELMSTDSVVIGTATTWDDPEEGEYTGLYQLKLSDMQPGRYVVKASCTGYETASVDFDLSSKRELSVHVRSIRLSKIRVLPEVTVQGTMIKMVMHGDTIVYNADAFNLAEGSMLDALIARLPGARLTREGQIWVNGRFVESLLINGRDFFSGNPKLALENLPAYTVNKVKVYDEAGAASRLMGRDMGDKRYVMDVILKKEYSTGYMGNAEAGRGSHDRYKARAFGLRFSELEYIMAFANLNNLSDDRQASIEGEWAPQAAADGQQATKTGGLSLVRFLDGQQNFVSSQNTFSHTDGDNQKHSATQTYLPGGDTWQRFQSSGRPVHTVVRTNNMLNLEKRRLYSTSTLGISYAHDKGVSQSLQELSDSTTLLNQLITHGLSSADHLTLDVSQENGLVIGPDMLRWEMGGSYDHLSATQFDQVSIHYTDRNTPNDWRNNYRRNSHKHLDLRGGVSYAIQWQHFQLTPEYEYRYRYNKTNSMLYRLDRLANADSTRFDVLPSTAEALASVADRGNSFRYRERQHRHQLQVAIAWNFDNGDLWKLSLPLQMVSKNLGYERTLRSDVSRHALFFSPDFFARGNMGKVYYELKASAVTDTPDMTLLVDYRDDSDPLNIMQGGGSRLKNIHRYDCILQLQRRNRRQILQSLNIGYHQRDNDVAYSLTVDKRTGIATSRPISVNGNWNAEVATGYTTTIGKARKITLDNQLSYSLHHGVDMATTEGLATSVRSIVFNHRMGDRLRLTFRPNDRYEFCLRGSGSYYLVSSRREGFCNIHAGDYNLGADATLCLPWKMQFTTDITMQARRGYNLHEMNTTDWIWNARLSRSFFKGRLLAVLQGFDMLHQLSATSYAINAQGRTETWQNSIPSYWMLSLQYQFKKEPKKR